MASRRPVPVLLVAIFHFIFGTIGVIGGLIGVGTAAYTLTQPRTPPGYRVTSYPLTMTDTMRYMDSNVPMWREASLALGLLGLGLSIVLIAAGVGLLLLKPWGRYLSLGYAGCSIVFQIGSLLYNVAYLMPAQLALYDQMAPPPGVNPAQFQMAMSFSKNAAGCGPVLALLGFIYPVVVLVVMLLPSVKRAFNGQAAPAEGPQDYDDRGEPDDRFGAAPR